MYNNPECFKLWVNQPEILPNWRLTSLQCQEPPNERLNLSRIFETICSGREQQGNESSTLGGFVDRAWSEN